MKRYIILGLMLLSSVVSYSNSSISSMREELLAVGVSEVEINNAQNVLDEALKRHKILSIEREQKELEINKLLVEDPEKNWEGISILFDELGQIEANLKKNQLKAQIEARKYISKDEYIKARDLYQKNHKKETSTEVKIKVN